MTCTDRWEDTLKRICVQKEDIGKNVRQYTVNSSTLLFCGLWDGIILWSNQIRDKFIPFSPEMRGCYITFNYCAEGRCELEFPVNNRYIYMKKGMISLNQIQPVNGYYYPGNRYDGLELAFDLDVLSDEFPKALADYGLTKAYLLDLISRHNSLLLASVSRKVITEADELLRYLRSGEVSAEKLRFDVLHLFFLMKEEGLGAPDEVSYVSKGQRQIVTEVEDRLTEDLSVHYVLSDLAKDYGISASALKKYFVQVYGNNVSDHLKIRRMEKAMDLLSETDKSVREIALSVGYMHQGKFAETFKEYAHCTPLEYRRLNYRRKRKKE